MLELNGWCSTHLDDRTPRFTPNSVHHLSRSKSLAKRSLFKINADTSKPSRIALLPRDFTNLNWFHPLCNVISINHSHQYPSSHQLLCAHMHRRKSCHPSLQVDDRFLIYRPTPITRFSSHQSGQQSPLIRRDSSQRAREQQL